MAIQDTPTARARLLAKELRLLREAAGLRGLDVAYTLDWSPSKVSRIETGRVGISLEDLDRLVELYHVPSDRADELRRLAPKVAAKGWWDAYAPTLDARFSTLLKHEAGSAKLYSYCAAVPHALLLTLEFTRRVLMSAALTPSPVDLERRIDVARRRQEVLFRAEQPLSVTAVIDEAVLLRLEALSRRSDSVARAQLEHLAAMAKRPNICVQILRLSAGLPPVSTGSFSVLAPFDTAAPDLVYSENKSWIFFIEDPREVHSFFQDFTKLKTMSLSRDDSAAFLDRSLARSHG